MAKEKISKNKQVKKYKNAADIITVTGSSNKIYTMGGKDKITLSKGKKNVIDAGAGNDTITISGGSSNTVKGGKGKDTFVIGKKSNGSAVIKDYTAGQDILKVTGGTITKATLSKKNIILNAGKAKITLENAKGKTISLQDSRGSYTMSSSALTLGKDFAGTMNSAVYLSSITKLDGSKATKALTLTGGSKLQTVTGGSGSDKISISGGTASVNGGAGTDIITVNGGNKHTLRGGTGSDTYVITPTFSSATRLTINQNDYKAKDTDVLELKNVNKNDVSYDLLNGTLTIKHKSGGTVTIAGWSQNPFSKIVFKGGTTITGTEATRQGETKEINWNLGNNTSFDASVLRKVLQINGYKENDFVVTLNSNGQLMMRDAQGGTLTISNWNKNTLQTIGFTAGNYTKTFTKNEFGSQIFQTLPITVNQTYREGGSVKQEFIIDLKSSTDIVMDTLSEAEDRIRFTGHSVDDVALRIADNNKDLLIRDVKDKNWTGGQVVIKDYKVNSVKTIEFNESAFHLVTGWNKDFIGSETIRDRYLFLDREMNGNGAPWNVTINGMDNKDILDFRFLPNNSRSYNMAGSADGRDMVLKYYVSASNQEVLLGTVRLKNVMNENGMLNMFPRVRTTREVYSGTVDDNGWVWNEDTKYRWLNLDLGTAGNDNTDLRNRTGLGSDGTGTGETNAWLYFAGDGNDTVTAHAGDMVYGGAGDDTINATGSYTDIQGGIGNDTIIVKGIDENDPDGALNLEYAVVRGGSGNDFIKAYGSYHFIQGGSGDDTIELRDDGNEGTEIAHNSAVAGGTGNDTISILAGHDHRVNGDDGDDEIHITDDGTKRSNRNRVFGGANNDKLYIENGGQNHFLYGNEGDDFLSVEGDNNILDGGEGSDTLTIISGTGNVLYGGEGSDTFIYAGSSVNGGHAVIKDYASGYDTVTLKSGTVTDTRVENGNDVVFTMDNGVGSITVESMAYDDILLENDNGSFVISGANNEIVLDQGYSGVIDGNGYSNVTGIYGSNTENSVTIYGNANNNSIESGNGDDKLFGGDGNDTLKSGAGDDELYGGEGADSLEGGSGNDTLYGGAENNELFGGEGEDSFVFTAESTGGNTIQDYGYYADNSNTISETIKLEGVTLAGTPSVVNVHHVEMDLSNGGKITVVNGANQVISIDNDGEEVAFNVGTTPAWGQDVTLLKGKNTVLSGGAENDVLTIEATAGNGNQMLGGEGDDSLFVNGGNNHLLRGGTGNDMYIISTPLTAKSRFTIQQEEAYEVVEDRLFLTEVDKDDVHYTLLNGTLSIIHTSGGKITVSGWNKNPLSNVYFANNDSLTGTEITDLADKTIPEGKVIINVSGTYPATGNGDTFCFEGEGWDAVITGATRLDSLDFSEYAGEEYAYAAGRTDNNLILTVKKFIGNTATVVGTVTLQDYYITANKISRFTLFDSVQDAVRTLNLVAGLGITDVQTVEGTENDDLIFSDSDKTVFAGDGDDIVILQNCEAVYGGSGKDTFIYDGAGRCTINDYEEGSDTLEINTGIIQYVGVNVYEDEGNTDEVTFCLENSGDYYNNYVKMQNVYNKVINIKDTRGNYSFLPKDTIITLASDFAGEMKVEDYINYSCSDVHPVIDGRNAQKSLTLHGCVDDDTIYGGSAADIIYVGGASSTVNTVYGNGGDDTIYGSEYGFNSIYGGDGDDIVHLYNAANYGMIATVGGGAGNDTVYIHSTSISNIFKYIYTSGNDVIQDVGSSDNYEVSLDFQDEQVTGIVRNHTDNKLIVCSGEGTITFKNIEKYLSAKITDARGTYEYHTNGPVKEDEEGVIILDNDFTGTVFDGSNFSGITQIQKRWAEQGVTIKGNSLANVICCTGDGNTLYGGDGDDVLYIGSGSNELYGGNGDDTFVFGRGGMDISDIDGNSIIRDYQPGKDIIKITETAFFGSDSVSGSVSGDDVLLNFNNKATVNVLGAAGQEITFDYGDGNLTGKVF